MPLPNKADATDALAAHIYWPFDNQAQWELAYWAMFHKPLSARRIRDGVVEGRASWIREGCGFTNLADFKRRCAAIPAKGGQWRQGFVTRGLNAASWQPAQVEFWKRDALEVLKDMVGDVRLAPHMTWSPKKLYNADRTRLYGELWSGDWWWNKQVFPFKIG